MGSICNEPPLEVESLLEPVEQCVVALRQPAHLVHSVPLRQPPVQVVRSDVARVLDNGGERLERLVSEHVRKDAGERPRE